MNLQKCEESLKRLLTMVRKNILVVDATTGQNGLKTSRGFKEATAVTDYFN